MFAETNPSESDDANEVPETALVERVQPFVVFCSDLSDLIDAASKLKIFDEESSVEILSSVPILKSWIEPESVPIKLSLRLTMLPFKYSFAVFARALSMASVEDLS